MRSLRRCLNHRFLPMSSDIQNQDMPFLVSLGTNVGSPFQSSKSVAH
jgi:hypothetical protein